MDVNLSLDTAYAFISDSYQVNSLIFKDLESSTVILQDVDESALIIPGDRSSSLILENTSEGSGLIIRDNDTNSRILEGTEATALALQDFPTGLTFLQDFQSAGGMTLIAHDPRIAIRDNTSKKIKDARRLRRTTFQARLGRKLDTIQRELSDNVIRLSSHPTDMLRIRVNRDERTRDILSRTIVSSEIMPIILPSMDKIPLRHLEGYREGTDVTIPSLYTISEQEYFELYAPVQSKLEPEDLLVRIIYDDVNCPDDPYVMILQVSEQLATIGYSSIRWMTYWATFYNQALPEKIINIIKAADKKRAILNW